jgi:hypothetical protein
VRNVIRVEAEADTVSFLVNGTKVLDVPRAAAGAQAALTKARGIAPCGGDEGSRRQ